MPSSKVMNIFSWILLFATIRLFHGEVLDGYAFPVYKTKFCPRNQKDWNERSSALNCTERNAFLCLPNENLTQLLEFCYSDSKIRIQEGICLFLYKRYSLVDAYECHGFTHGCPNTSHFSDEIYKYPSCVSLGEGCFLSEPFCTRRTLPKRSHEDNNLVWILMLFGIILTIATIISIILCFKRESVSRFLRRFFKVRCRETNTELKHAWYEEIIQISEETPRQMVLQDQHQGYPLLAENDNDPRISDVLDLEKYGVLIFISDDKHKVGQRMLSIADNTKFGKSRFEYSLMIWEPDEDVNLHLFLKPLDDNFSDENLKKVLQDMYKRSRVSQSQQTYFVQSFESDHWQKYKTALLKYDFFNTAKIKMI